MYKNRVARVTKLEQQNLAQRNLCNVVVFNPSIPNSKIDALKRVGTNRIMIVIDHGTDEEWEAALLKQQEKLVSLSYPS